MCVDLFSVQASANQYSFGWNGAIEGFQKDTGRVYDDLRKLEKYNDILSKLRDLIPLCNIVTSVKRMHSAWVGKWQCEEFNGVTIVSRKMDLPMATRVAQFVRGLLGVTPVVGTILLIPIDFTATLVIWAFGKKNAQRQPLPMF